MASKKSTAERGKFKTEVSTALYKSEKIRKLLLGDTSNLSPSETISAFKNHVKSHLFIDDTMTEKETFIFYDVSMPFIHTQIENPKIVMYLIAHRDILEDYSEEGYYGDRIDILSQMVEEALLDKEVINKFGIGELKLDSIEIYNSMTYYGCIMVYTVPTFR